MNKISAFVITCDKDPKILNAVLGAITFADELILVDKSKGPRLGGYVVGEKTIRVVNEEWTPVVEDTRTLALSYCSHDWVICLDDDEILSPACSSTFHDFIASGRAEILYIPIKHYILGRHDPAAYYWPEWRPVLHRRGSIQYIDAVHNGTVTTGGVEQLRLDHPAFITHLSHPDVSTWLEKTNRYTSQPDHPEVGYRPRDYLDAVRTLRNIYDMIAGLKRWEAENLPNGTAEFLRIAHDE